MNLHFSGSTGIVPYCITIAQMVEESYEPSLYTLGDDSKSIAATYKTSSIFSNESAKISSSEWQSSNTIFEDLPVSSEFSSKSEKTRAGKSYRTRFGSLTNFFVSTERTSLSKSDKNTFRPIEPSHKDSTSLLPPTLETFKVIANPAKEVILGFDYEARYSGQSKQKKKLQYGPKVSPYLNPKISVAGIVMRKNNTTGELEMLLLRRWIDPQKGFWELPGDFIGHQDPGSEVLRILKHQTNLSGTHADFICARGDPTRDERDHNVTLFFFVSLPDSEHEIQLTPVLKMEQEGTVVTKMQPFSKIDHRISPSWAWWYPVSQLPNWYTDQERIDLNYPLDDDYELVKVAFDHILIFPLIKRHIQNHLHRISVIDSPKQPLNHANSALTTDVIVVRKRRDHVYEIALIERGAHPFQGRKGLPGGFINYREDPILGALREMEEETFLTGTPSNAFLLTYKGSTARDVRQHSVSLVYVLKADPESLSQLKSDDESFAQWYRLAEAFEWAKTSNTFAFDHAEIILDFKAWWESTGEKDGWYVEEKISV
ncbi:hypothetical protein HK098_006097 [Nowakowskiella sp. JEL0407]|nr:hypothetical protein HK098_006097 [Nowakowskiella sp. JEL0407]